MHLLDTVSGKAAENMAVDQLLLTHYPEPAEPRFRHYGWTEPAHTFGFAQAWSEELEALTAVTKVIRRETGGGLVDHRQAWTWTLVLPPNHPASKDGLTCLYSQAHKALQKGLVAQSISAKLQDTSPEPLPSGTFRACFRRTEQHDVILPDGYKVAGAAQRRTREGLLIQGYVDCQPLPGLDWDKFLSDFAGIISEWLQSPIQRMPMPKFPKEALTPMKNRFASKAWNHSRRRTNPNETA